MKHHIVIYHRTTVQPEIVFRTAEHKLGEHIQYLEPDEKLADLKRHARNGVRFALLGIPESIGVEANFGKCCTDNAWPAFLKFFLNIQSNRFFKGNNILCLGHIDTGALNRAAAALDRIHPDFIQQMRELCSRLDDRVHPVIEQIVKAGIIPVVIGGGHNNAYPIIKGTATALGATEGINCINCDPHADFRQLEGRHSGNSFSYAYQAGYLSRYLVFGLDENYNSEAVLEAIDQNKNVAYRRFDPNADLIADAEQAAEFFSDSKRPVGIELDMDSISDMPSSFATPSGLSVKEARSYLRKITSQLKPAYLHLPEGAPVAGSDDEIKVGKTLSYLVIDFIKSCTKKHSV
jgi:formiminoglutamase